MLLKRMSFVGYVGDNFIAGSETHFCDLADSRVRLFGRAGHHLHAYAARNGFDFNAGALVLETTNVRGLRTNWLIVGIFCVF